MLPRHSAISTQLEEIASDCKLQKDLEIVSTFCNVLRFSCLRTTLLKFQKQYGKFVQQEAMALQFPEGLLMYACVISDILEKHTDCNTVIMGDVTYGACCVDDYTAKSLGCDLLVHYGHSCLVPIQNTEGINMLYVFVNIDINLSHFEDCLKTNFQRGEKIALVSTIQFIRSLQTVKQTLNDSGFELVLPQCKPLSPGEVLGCTSPRLSNDINALIYLGDGRFHLESAMIHNPHVKAYQYDPYSRMLTREHYDFNLMKNNRMKAVSIAKNCQTFGIIHGTLGRQGNIKIVEELEQKLSAHGKFFLRVLLSEIFPDKLSCFPEVDCWVQVACPRLSIDWGLYFPKPLLSPYELAVALDEVAPPTDYYPMDYYANDSTGPWTNNHEKHRPERKTRRPHILVTASEK